MYGCTEIVNDVCTEWVPLVYGLPVLTESEVYTLGAAAVLCYALAFGLGILARMLFQSTASRHG